MSETTDEELIKFTNFRVVRWLENCLDFVINFSLYFLDVVIPIVEFHESWHDVIWHSVLVHNVYALKVLAVIILANLS